MELARLILVPQLNITMRYQEWWLKEFYTNLKDHYDEVHVIHPGDPVSALNGNFSAAKDSVINEALQIKDFMAMDVTKKDTLLHFDLSYPGLFHNVLYHHRPGRCYVFCHASALNKYDIFQPVRNKKWQSEKNASSLYDKVFVASNYHYTKLRLPNAINLGALPNPPDYILPEQRTRKRRISFLSTARPTKQKIDMQLEHKIGMMANKKISRHLFLDWRGYYKCLDRAQNLLVTAKEETYGYQIVDAVLRGCVPIAPNAFSYPELLPKKCLYEPTLPLQKKADKIFEIAKKVKKITLLNDNLISNFWNNLLKEMKND